MAVWDMHSDEKTRVPAEERLTEGTLVQGEVVCHHGFGIGVLVSESHQYGHVDVPYIRDGVVRQPDDYPPIGQVVSGVVLGYDGHGQLRLTTRLHDLPGYV